MKFVPVFALVGCLAAAACSQPAGEPQELTAEEAEAPFRLGQYDSGDAGGVVIEVAERRFPLAAQAPPGSFPDDLIALIEQYSSLRRQLYAVANRLGTDSSRAVLPPEARLTAPLRYPFNLLAAAVNYRRHGEEMGRRLGESYGLDDPYIFAKSPRASIASPDEPLVLPPGRERIDWEVELAVVIGRQATRVPAGEALDFAFGYTLMLDISDRGGRDRKDAQFDVDWFSGKSRDGFAPLGPWVVPAEFVGDPSELSLRLAVNGEVMQAASSSQMIHDVAGLIAYISSIQTLYPGDVIATGTPPGVGAGRQPPRFLQPGDVIEAEIEGISSMKVQVVAPPE